MKLFSSLLFIGLLFSQDIKKELDAFTKIKVDVAAHTEIEFGDRFYIEVDGREKDIDKLDIYVSGSTLRIEREGSRRFFSWFNSSHSKNMKIKIVTKSLRAIDFNASGTAEIATVNTDEFDIEINGSTDVEMSGEIEKFDINIDGSGNLDVNELRGDILDVSINGSGDLKLKGKADAIEIGINGSGNVSAYKLEVEEADIKIMGSGDVRIHANKELNVSIMGSGDVTYKGNPRVKDRIMGSGDVEKY